MSARRPHQASSDVGSQPDPHGCDWYAVTEDGASAVRLTQSLTLGEREDGELALNAGAAESRWVTFDLTADGAAVVTCPTGCLLDPAGRPLKRQPLEPGLCLDLPNNRVRISRSIQNPAADGPVVSVRGARADSGGVPSTPAAAARATAREDSRAAAPDGRAANPSTPVDTRSDRLEPGMSPWRSVLIAGAVLGIVVLVVLADR